MRPRSTSALQRACHALVDDLKRHRLCELPAKPLKAGSTTPALPVDRDRAGSLLTLAARDAAGAASGGSPGFLTTAAEDLARVSVWSSGADALLVLLDALEVQTAEGLVTISIEVACDQLLEVTGKPRATIDIDFVVGTQQRPTGLLAAATPPRGPQLIVDRWGDALTAFAWQALLDTAAGLSVSAGVDEDGVGLIPSTWTATGEGIAVQPQARHPLDRRPARAVVG